MTISAPEPIVDRHHFEAFSCGLPPLDEWLKRRARKNQASEASRAFVVREADRVVGFYALAAGGVEIAAAAGRFRRNMPDPIPVVVLGRLAIDRDFHGRGLGRALFGDAGKRMLHAAESIGIRGLLVHALTDEAKSFYLTLGFELSPIDHMTLMVSLSDLAAAL